MLTSSSLCRPGLRRAGHLNTSKSSKHSSGNPRSQNGTDGVGETNPTEGMGLGQDWVVDDAGCCGLWRVGCTGRSRICTVKASPLKSSGNRGISSCDADRRRLRWIVSLGDCASRLQLAERIKANDNSASVMETGEILGIFRSERREEGALDDYERAAKPSRKLAGSRARADRGGWSGLVFDRSGSCLTGGLGVTTKLLIL